MTLGQQTSERRASANKVLPKAGVTNFYETFVLYSTLVFQINSSAETPAFGNTQTVSGYVNEPSITTEPSDIVAYKSQLSYARQTFFSKSSKKGVT